MMETTLSTVSIPMAQHRAVSLTTPTSTPAATSINSPMTTSMSLTVPTTFGSRPDQVSKSAEGSSVLVLFRYKQLTRCQVVFPKTSVAVHWSIFGGSQGLGLNASAGTSDNGFQKFWVYKDSGTFLYSRDGWRCDSIYFAF